ncbi:MAG: hypothetical protein U0324_06510 [Polyangiales bacterium]
MDLPAPALPRPLPSVFAVALALLAGCDGTVSIVGRRTPDATVADDTPDAVVTADADVPAPDARPPDVTPGMDASVDADVAPPTDVPADADAPAPTPLPRVIVNCGAVCTRPLDAVLDAMGRTVYFTGFTAARVPAIFRAAVPAPGAMPVAPTVLVAGMGLVFPSGLALSNDDATLYVADMAADRGTDDASLGLGAVFSVAAVGGTPSIVNLGAALVHPTSVTVSIDGADLLVSAQRLESDGTRSHGVFRAPRAGSGTPASMLNLTGPSGISQSAAGAIVVIDLRRNGPNAGSLVTVAPGGPVFFAGDLVASYPAGLAHSVDGRSILVSAATPAVGPGLLTLVGPDGRSTAPASLSQGMAAPLGLHRARLVDAWAVADETAGDNGQVFLLNGPL